MTRSHDSSSNQSLAARDHTLSLTSPSPPGRKSVTFHNDTYGANDTERSFKDYKLNEFLVSDDTNFTIPYLTSSEEQALDRDFIENQYGSSSENTLGGLIRDELIEPSEEGLERFLPRDKIESILTQDTILRTLSEEGGVPLEQQRSIAQQILNPTENITSTQPHLRSRKEILIILSLIEKVDTIGRFLQEGLFDYDLPFTYIRERVSTKGTQRRSIVKTGNLERQSRTIFLFSDWRVSEIEAFQYQQRKIHVPVFSPTSEIDKPRHYFLAQETICPYISQQEVGRGGFSAVNRVEIHPSHVIQHGSAPKKTVFAIKKLHTSEKKLVDEEIAIHYRFMDKDYPHLIRLLWTFSVGSIYHLVFPCADGNLMDLWRQHDSPLAKKRDHSTALWFARQCLGIVEGLSVIHQNDHQDLPKHKQHGRHGDLKPENILWFQSANTSEPGYSLGTLKISDFGLTRFHSTNSRSGINADGVGGSRTYRAPEYDVLRQVAQSYDIWSLACVLLEFTTWYLKGWSAVDSFATARKDEDTTPIPIMEDTFFNHRWRGKIMSAVAKRSVVNEVRSLYEHTNGSDFIIDIVNLIETGLLRMSPDSRKSCREIHEELERIFEICTQDHLYCLEKVKKPPSRKNTEKSLLEPVDLTRPFSIHKWVIEDGYPQPVTRQGSGSSTRRHYTGSQSSRKSSISRGEETLALEPAVHGLSRILSESPVSSSIAAANTQNIQRPPTETENDTHIVDGNDNEPTVNSSMTEQPPENPLTKTATLQNGHIKDIQREVLRQQLPDEILARPESGPTPSLSIGQDPERDSVVSVPKRSRKRSVCSLLFIWCIRSRPTQ